MGVKEKNGEGEEKVWTLLHFFGHFEKESEATNYKDEREDKKHEKEQTDKEFSDTLDIVDDKIPAEEKTKTKTHLS
jgi:hypothetical protein